MALVKKQLADILTVSRASGGGRFNAQGVFEIVPANVPRINYDPVTLACRGILIEEQRTNFIRNNSMRGAVTGTPGTLPTNWANNLASAGLNQQVVGIGSENGITYIDLRIFGTPATGFADVLYFDGGAAYIAATANQNWTASAYLKVVGGTLSNLEQAALTLREADSGGLFLRQTLVDIKTISSALKRVSNTATTGASTAFVIPGIRCSYFANTAVDFTLRIGLPQLEIGSFATSAIPTSGTQVTRTTDIPVISGPNFTKFYNKSQGTFVVEFDSLGSTNKNNDAAVFCVTNPLTNFAPCLSIIYNDISGVNRPATVIYDESGTSQTNGVYGANNSMPPGISAKVLMSYKTNDVQMAMNGALIGTRDTSVVLPTAVDRLYLGNFYAAGNRPLNGHIKRFAFYPRAYPDAILKKLSTLS